MIVMSSKNRILNMQNRFLSTQGGIGLIGAVRISSI